MPLSREDLQRLDAMGSAELRAWISEFIATGDPSPLDLVFDGRSALDSFIVFVRDVLPDDSYRLRDRIQTAVSELAGSVAPDEDSRFDYLWDVITAATRLKAYHLKGVIIPKINLGEFRGKHGRSEDLHCCFIEAVTDLGLGVNEVSILRRRDINDPLYSVAAYRGLYTTNPEWALECFPLVVDAIRMSDDPRLEMAFVLEDLVDVLDERFVTSDLANHTLQNIADGQLVDLFFDVLPEVLGDEDVYGRVADQLEGQGWKIQSWPVPGRQQYRNPEMVALFTQDRRGGKTVISQCERLVSFLRERERVSAQTHWAQDPDAVKQVLNEIVEQSDARSAT